MFRAYMEYKRSDGGWKIYREALHGIFKPPIERLYFIGARKIASNP